VGWLCIYDVMVNLKKRFPIVSGILSLLMPGLGQIYNGHIKKGIFLFIWIILLALLMGLTSSFGFIPFILILGVALVVNLSIIAEAVISSIKLKEVELKRYNRWYCYMTFGILGVIIVNIAALSAREIYGSWIFSIPTDSMSSTISKGDIIVVNPSYYKSNKLNRCDIAVFMALDDNNKIYNKRVIGLPGEVLEIKNEIVYINDQPLLEPYKLLKDKVEKYEDFMQYKGRIEIPKNMFFVLGDNRHHSYDSRYWGFVPIENLRGKVLYICFSENFDKIGQDLSVEGITRNNSTKF